MVFLLKASYLMFLIIFFKIEDYLPLSVAVDAVFGQDAFFASENGVVVSSRCDVLIHDNLILANDIHVVYETFFMNVNINHSYFFFLHLFWQLELNATTQELLLSRKVCLTFRRFQYLVYIKPIALSQQRTIFHIFAHRKPQIFIKIVLVINFNSKLNWTFVISSIVKDVTSCWCVLRVIEILRKMLDVPDLEDESCFLVLVFSIVEAESYEVFVKELVLGVGFEVDDTVVDMIALHNHSFFDAVEVLRVVGVRSIVVFEFVAFCNGIGVAY